MKGARKLFPKIVIKNLRDFPFPRRVENKLVKEVARLVKKINGLTVDSSEYKKVELEIEKCVISSFIDGDIEKISKELQKKAG